MYDLAQKIGAFCKIIKFNYRLGPGKENLNQMASAPDKGETELGKLARDVNTSLDEGKVRMNANGGNAPGANGGENPKTAIKIEAPPDLKSEIFPVEQQVEVKQGFLSRCRNKCCSGDNNKKQSGFESNPNARVKNTIKRIVNGRFVLTLMTFVTIFALIGVSTANAFVGQKFQNSNFFTCNG